MVRNPISFKRNIKKHFTFFGKYSIIRVKMEERFEKGRDFRLAMKGGEMRDGQ